jgi:iron(III) transport system ATP-binding protein
VRIGAAEVAVDMPFQSGRELFELGGQAMLSLRPRSLHWL